MCVREENGGLTCVILWRFLPSLPSETVRIHNSIFDQNGHRGNKNT